MSRTPLETARAVFEAVNAADWQRGIALWHEDVVLDVQVHGIRAGVYEGREEVTKWFTDWFTTFDAGAQFDLEEMTELEDGSVLAVATHRARGRGSGVEITGQVVWRYVVEDGLITRQIGHETREDAIAAAGAED